MDGNDQRRPVAGPSGALRASKIAPGDFVEPLRGFLVQDTMHKIKKGPRWDPFFCFVAEWTGLEPATPGVTGRYSNQLNYHSVYGGC